MSDSNFKVFTLGPTSDGYITLANEEWLGKLTIGNNWNSIRIGIMCAITADGTNNFPAPNKLIVGVCSSAAIFENTKGISQPTVKNYIGLTGSITTQWSYLNGPGAPVIGGGTTTTAYHIHRGINGVITTPVGSTTGLYNQLLTGGTANRRGLFYVDIIKGSPNYTLVGHSFNSSNSAFDTSLTTFLNNFDITNPLMSTGSVSMSSSGNSTAAFDETAGPLDTVSVFWNKSQFPLELYAVAAKRLS